MFLQVDNIINIVIIQLTSIQIYDFVFYCSSYPNHPIFH